MLFYLFLVRRAFGIGVLQFALDWVAFASFTFASFTSARVASAKLSTEGIDNLVGGIADGFAPLISSYFTA